MKSETISLVRERLVACRLRFAKWEWVKEASYVTKLATD